MDRSDRRDHIIYNLPTYPEAHLAVHRVGRQAMNFRFAIFRSSYAASPDMGATTHAGVLSGCIEYLKEAGFSDISVAVL